MISKNKITLPFSRLRRRKQFHTRTHKTQRELPAGTTCVSKCVTCVLQFSALTNAMGGSYYRYQRISHQLPVDDAHPHAHAHPHRPNQRTPPTANPHHGHQRTAAPKLNKLLPFVACFVGGAGAPSGAGASAGAGTFAATGCGAGAGTPCGAGAGTSGCGGCCFSAFS